MRLPFYAKRSLTNQLHVGKQVFSRMENNSKTFLIFSVPCLIIKLLKRMKHALSRTGHSFGMPQIFTHESQPDLKPSGTSYLEDKYENR
jgi:hypothetical protein